MLSGVLLNMIEPAGPIYSSADTGANLRRTPLDDMQHAVLLVVYTFEYSFAVDRPGVARLAATGWVKGSAVEGHSCPTTDAICLVRDERFKLDQMRVLIIETFSSGHVELINQPGEACNSLECADLSALRSVATSRDYGSPEFTVRLGDRSPKTKVVTSHRTPKFSLTAFPQNQHNPPCSPSSRPIMIVLVRKSYESYFSKESLAPSRSAAFFAGLLQCHRSGTTGTAASFSDISLENVASGVSLVCSDD